VLSGVELFCWPHAAKLCGAADRFIDAQGDKIGTLRAW